jgi:hypothetical protein
MNTIERTLITFALGLIPAVANAQMPHMHGAPKDTSMAGMDMGEMPMEGLLGRYPMTREASGTAWQPDAARHDGVHLMSGSWMLMLHGFADVTLDAQGGHRGDTKVFSSNMGMAMAQRPLGPGVLGLRAMLSLEPATIGKEGYPLLLQTGETADGVTPLIDRQHPHDLFMELAGTYRAGPLFVYGGLPGEPALGPPAFMHRFSGANIPLAPITHHWLDSTHITYGVLTLGGVAGRFKAEASTFRGREPDQDRWGIETPKLDSHSFRVSANPGEHWSLQASWGKISSPEQLEPEVDQERITASAMVDGTTGDTGRWEATLAWGRNRNSPGHVLDAFTAEGALAWGGKHAVFARAERVQKDELIAEPDPRAGTPYTVGEATAGYRCDVLRREHFALGIGLAGTAAFVPEDLHADYGDTPLSGLLFLHAEIR